MSRVLGHSNICTTAYAQLTPAMSQRVADRLDGVLRKPAAKGPVVARVAAVESRDPSEAFRGAVSCVNSLVGATGFEPATS